MKSLRLIQTASLLVALSGIASAQWTVTNLHPAGAYNSMAFGASGNKQVGIVSAIVEGSPRQRATQWSGTAASRINLHPSWARASEAVAISNGTLVGRTWVDENYWIGSSWTGSLSSWNSPHPAGAYNSKINAVSGTDRVGFIQVGVYIDNRACIWSGPGENYTNLHPSYATESEAYGASDGFQVGFFSNYQGGPRAALWAGTANSTIDLHPIGMSHSKALSVSNGSQVGYVTSFYNIAALWYGNATSFVRLGPENTSSTAYGVLDSYQVGVAGTGNFQVNRASVWTGTAASRVEINPEGYYSSEARAISKDDSNYYIVGFGYPTNGSQPRALLWTLPIQPARTISGSLDLQDTSGDSGFSGEEIGWNLTIGSTSFTGRFTTASSGGGAFSFEIPTWAPFGNYRLRFKGGTFLRSTYNISFDGTSIPLNISLRNGDIDQDGEVGPGDFEAVVGQFGGPGNADADNDGEVGPSDFEVVVANFGLQDQ